MKPSIAEIHPELQSFTTKLPTLTLNSWMLRPVYWLSFLIRGTQPPDDVRIENHSFPAQDQKNIRVRIYRPKSVSAAAPAMLWLHGGGYVIGKPEIDDALCIQYVQALGIVIASVDYRLAPDHPFPVGLEDSYSGLKWLTAQGQTLQIDPDRIAIGGESGGAGLAAALVQLTHDRAEINPVFQLLIYPMLDDRTTLRTDNLDRDYLAWNRASNRFAWEAYLGKKVSRTDTPPYAVPSRRTDLSGLPPTWIGVGSLDQFHDEDVAYAQRLNDCGVACELVVVPGAFHGFDASAPQTAVVQAFRKAQIAALKRSLFPA